MRLRMGFFISLRESLLSSAGGNKKASCRMAAGLCFRLRGAMDHPTKAKPQADESMMSEEQAAAWQQACVLDFGEQWNILRSMSGGGRIYVLLSLRESLLSSAMGIKKACCRMAAGLCFRLPFRIPIPQIILFCMD